MRRLLNRLSLVITLLSVLWAPSIVLAANDAPKLFLDGRVVLDSAPVIVDGTTLVPFRSLSELTGATVTWDGETQTAIAARGTVEVRLSIGQMTATVNGVSKSLPVPPRIIDSKTYVPMRFIAEALGLTVSWDERYQFVLLDSPGQTDGSASILWGLTLTINNTAQVTADKMADLLGRKFIDRSTDQVVWVVGLEPGAFETELVLREEDGSERVVRQDPLTFERSFRPYEQYTEAKEKADHWLSLRGKTLWIKAADLGYRLPASVKNLEPVIVSEVQFGGLADSIISLTIQTSSGLHTLEFSPQLDPSGAFILNDPKTLYPGWSDRVWQAIQGKKVFIGMSAEQAALAWGHPDKVNRTTNAYLQLEQWVYGDNYLYFEDGVLTTIQN